MRTFYILAGIALPSLVLACGDDGLTTASDGATAPSLSGSTSSTDGPPPTDGSASQTGTGEPSGGQSVSESEGVPTSSTTDVVATGTTTIDTTGTSGSTDATTSSSTTGGPLTCEDPPPGHAGPIDPTCAAEPQIGMFNPVVEWKESAWAINPESINVMMTPIVTSLTDDNADGKIDDGDVPDIVYVTYSPGVLRATSGDGGGHLFSVGANEVGGQAGVAAGDIDGDGIVELVVSGVGAVHCYEHDGAKKWQYANINEFFSSYSAPAIADMDGDGSPEVIVGRVILDADGSLRGIGTHGAGGSYGATSFAADITGDGVQEVVVGDALYRPDGTDVWYNGLGDGYPAVADFDLDGTPEIVVVRDGSVSLQDAAGINVWTTPLPGSGGGGPPTIADYDGDGAPEIGVAGRDVYGMFDADGSLVWSNVTQDLSSGFTGSSVYDFEGDGVADVVYADETNLWVYSGTDGAVKLQFQDHNSNTALEYPLVADVDADGQVEILLGHNTTGGHGPEMGITVIGDMDSSWRPGRPVWNQHAYSITNIEDDGSVPPDPVDNWTIYNNFRSGDLSPPDGDASPDLTLEAEVCQADCAGGQLIVWANLGNIGASALTAGATLELFTVTAGVETLVDMVLYPDPLPEGTFTDAFVFNLMNPQTFDSLIFRVSTTEEECDLTNNEITLEGPFCADVPE